MTDAGNEMSREELLGRVELMQTMIAEGRRTTGRHGWIFVMWGLVYVIAMLWAGFLPAKLWAWPVCVSVAVVIHVVEKSRRRGRPDVLRTRTIESVWRALGITITLFVIGAGVSHHGADRAYFAGIFLFVGMAHGASAMILRWKAQGLTAGLWWACGIGVFFATRPEQVAWTFIGASLLGMIGFGLYAMARERRRGKPLVASHA